MPPVPFYVEMRSLVSPIHSHIVARNVTSVSELKNQWTNPSDILSLLLLLGPDVIQRALAQLVGRRVTPVAFSFGWAAYSVTALFSAIGGKSPCQSCKYWIIL